MKHGQPLWTQSNQGDTTTFWSCGICGASVQTQDKETHEKWHKWLDKLVHKVHKCVRAPERKC